MPGAESKSTPRVLIVEDEQKTRDSLAEGLELESWIVSTAATGEAACTAVSRNAFDLVILDWMLPDRDGIELLHCLRGSGLFAPVLMLSARRAVDERIMGLDGGADDYLAKPFAFAELLARCRALLRRPTYAQGRIVRCEDLQLDTASRIAKRAGEEIQLTPREVDLLEYLLRRQGQTVTREMLEREVWKQSRRLTSLDNVIDVQMMRLRRKIDGERLHRLIHTVRGVGYRMGGHPG